MRFFTPLAVIFVALSCGAASAADYHPATLTACQKNASSMQANSRCFSNEINKLAVKLPAGSGPWMESKQNQCEKSSAHEGQAGIGIALDCLLQAVATKVGARN